MVIIGLESFVEDQVLCDIDDNNVTDVALCQAVQIAMLGLGREANAILAVVAAHTKFKPELQLRYLWAEGGFEPPSALKDYKYEDTLEEAEGECLKQLPYLPDSLDWDNISEESLKELHDLTIKQAGMSSSNASTGYNAMVSSSQYAALLTMAFRLNRQDVISTIIPDVAKRIHANQQVAHLTLIRALWEPYFLSGKLREYIGISLADTQEYANIVSDVITRRLQEGPMRLETLYKGFSTRQLLEEIDQNTIKDPEYAEYPGNVDYNPTGDAIPPSSILHNPATEEEIEEAEQRFGRNLPEDIKAYLRICNGCRSIRVGPTWTYFSKRLPPLTEMKLEDGDWMEYELALLDCDHERYEVGWPEIGSGIAMYEHQGQHTQFIWILDAEQIKEAKSVLADVYEEADEEVKEAIDKQILTMYGSREKYDGMNEYCLFEQAWGESESKVFPNFRSYLIQVAFESKHMVDRSPLKQLEDKY